jgi:hypothetical protein
MPRFPIGAKNAMNVFTKENNVLLEFVNYVIQYAKQIERICERVHNFTVVRS